jgi:hypothetical protein
VHKLLSFLLVVNGCFCSISLAQGSTAPSPTITSKWSTSFYGFVETDFISDSTESFNESAGNGAISRPGSYAATHKRFMIGARHSRIGFRLNVPELGGIRTSANIEADFLGNQPSPLSESAFFVNATFRLRHAFMKIETEYVDVLIGQTWQLFGWQGYFHPNTVEIQGVPGQVFSRSPQIRLSHTFKLEPVSVEVAVAASRPPQRDAGLPDGQAGIRLTLNGRKGVRTAGGTGTSADAAALGVSGALRRFNVAEFTAAPVNDVSTSGSAYSIDLFFPIIEGTLKDKGNALTFTGSFANGSGFADLFTGLTGGTRFPGLPPPATYNPNIDTGLAIFLPDGTLHTVDFRAYIVGLQYYLPPDGRFWVSSNFSQTYSENAANFGPANGVFNRAWWADGNIFMDVTPAVRVGLEYAYFSQTYVDNVNATNHRFQMSAWFLF